VKISLGGECPGHPDDVIATRTAAGAPPRIACVAKAALEGLSVPAADLVDRHAFGARSDEVIEITLRAGDATLDVARAGAQWHERTPLDRAVDGADRVRGGRRS
jgi:hypothetical protein